MEKEEARTEEKKNFYKKWWFWGIIAIIIIVLGCIAVMLMKQETIEEEEVEKLAIGIQKIYAESTIYTSINEEILFIELRNWDNDYNTRLEQILDLIHTEIKNGKLQTYNKLVMLSYLKGKDKGETMLIKNVNNLPDFAEDKTNTQSYIIFEEYENLFNTLSRAMF